MRNVLSLLSTSSAHNHFAVERKFAVRTLLAGRSPRVRSRSKSTDRRASGQSSKETYTMIYYQLLSALNGVVLSIAVLGSPYYPKLHQIRREKRILQRETAAWKTTTTSQQSLHTAQTEIWTPASFIIPIYSTSSWPLLPRAIYSPL